MKRSTIRLVPRAKRLAPTISAYRRLEKWWLSLGSAALAPDGYRGGWWPAGSPVEIMMTAILVQNTRWENVARAVVLLKEASLLPAGDSIDAQAACLRAIHARGFAGLQAPLRPAGCASVKARRVWNLADFLVQSYDADISRLAAVSDQELRRQLLAVSGIGPETADAILLYALDRPAFPVDGYLRRIYRRHGWSISGQSDEPLRAGVLSGLSRDVARLHRYHALVVEIGKRYCGTVADCGACPLRGMLPRR